MLRLCIFVGSEGDKSGRDKSDESDDKYITTLVGDRVITTFIPLLPYKQTQPKIVPIVVDH
jgi:hypothetical protein